MLRVKKTAERKAILNVARTGKFSSDRMAKPLTILSLVGDAEEEDDDDLEESWIPRFRRYYFLAFSHQLS